MNNTIFYLFGFPGVGKYTIAKELCAQEPNIRLVDNHLINNPLFSLIRQDGKTLLPKRIWSNAEKIWEAVFDTMVHISPPEYSFVLTNALFDHNQEDHAWFARIQKLAEAERNGLFVPVRLICGVEENTRRIVSAERHARMKETNPESPRRNNEKYKPLMAGHPNLLELDTTSAAPAESAQAILDHARSRA